MKKLSVLLLCSMIFLYHSYGQITLIPYGDSWKYLDNGTDQGTAWQALTYDDGTWKTGNGKFGYGITDITTTVSYGPNSKSKYITTYFRKKINMANPAAYSLYNAWVKRD